MTLNDNVKRQVRKRANYLCEYCHSSEEASAANFAIDHIMPRSLGGADDLGNLALACQRCNGYRYNFVTGIDPITQEEIQLFNPRIQVWADHFIMTLSGWVFSNARRQKRSNRSIPCKVSVFLQRKPMKHRAKPRCCPLPIAQRVAL